MRDARPAFWPFFAVWVTIGVAAFVFFRRSGDVELKRRIYPAYVIGSAILLAAFVLYTASHWTVPLAMLPLLAVIVLINLRSVRFCGACGRMMQGRTPFERPNFCSNCGETLDV